MKLGGDLDGADGGEQDEVVEKVGPSTARFESDLGEDVRLVLNGEVMA